VKIPQNSSAVLVLHHLSQCKHPCNSISSSPAEHHITSSIVLESKAVFRQVCSHVKRFPDLVQQLSSRVKPERSQGHWCWEGHWCSMVSLDLSSPNDRRPLHPVSHQGLLPLSPLLASFKSEQHQRPLSVDFAISGHWLATRLQFCYSSLNVKPLYFRNVVFSYVTTQHVAYGRWQQKLILWDPQ